MINVNFHQIWGELWNQVTYIRVDSITLTANMGQVCALAWNWSMSCASNFYNLTCLEKNGFEGG